MINKTFCHYCQNFDTYLKCIEVLLNHPHCDINITTSSGYPAIYTFIRTIEIIRLRGDSSAVRGLTHEQQDILTRLLDRFIDKLDFDRQYCGKPLLRIVCEAYVNQSNYGMIAYTIKRLIDKGIKLRYDWENAFRPIEYVLELGWFDIAHHMLSTGKISINDDRDFNLERFCRNVYHLDNISYSAYKRGINIIIRVPFEDVVLFLIDHGYETRNNVQLVIYYYNQGCGYVRTFKELIDQIDVQSLGEVEIGNIKRASFVSSPNKAIDEIFKSKFNEVINPSHRVEQPRQEPESFYGRVLNSIRSWI